MCFAIVSIVIVAFMKIPPAINSDPAWGIVAAKQAVEGKSTSPLYMVHADFDDVTKDYRGRVAWWAPSYQILPFVFVKVLHCNWGMALRFVTILVWLSGISGWAFYFWRILQSRQLFLGLFALLITYRFTHSYIDIYDGESLLWGFAPWIVNLNSFAVERSGSQKKYWLPIVAGLVTPLIFLVKYNSALLTVGLLLSWWIFAFLRTVHLRHAALFTLTWGLTYGCIYLSGFPGGATTANPDVHVRLDWKILWTFGGWIYSPTDLDGLFRWLFFKPSAPIISGDAYTGFLAVSSFIFLGFAALNFKKLFVWLKIPNSTDSHRDECFKKILALTCFVTSCSLLAFLAAESRSDLVFPRYLRVESLMVLPYLFLGVIHLAASSRSWLKIAGFAIFTIYFIVPSVYGLVALVDKAWLRTQNRITTDGEGIRHDILAGDNGKAFFSEIESKIGKSNPLLFISSPDLAIPLSNHRFIAQHTDFVPLEELKSMKYRGRPADGVIIIYPKYFAQNFKLEAICQSFQDIQEWKQESLASSKNWTILRGK